MIYQGLEDYNFYASSIPIHCCYGTFCLILYLNRLIIVTKKFLEFETN